VRFRTNDLGFIDHEDYLVPGQSRADAPRYAFVGDSFTAGFHGGTPWVPALRDRARKTNPDLQIYNLGVSGTGFDHFGRLLKSFATDVDFSEIVILAISDDFERPFWPPPPRGNVHCRRSPERPWLRRDRPLCLKSPRPCALGGLQVRTDSRHTHLVGRAVRARRSPVSRRPRARGRAFRTFSRADKGAGSADRRSIRARRA
jgi:hypothetical protein